MKKKKFKREREKERERERERERENPFCVEKICIERERMAFIIKKYKKITKIKEDKWIEGE